MDQNRCLYCGIIPLKIVHVHGHGQCSNCGVNIEPCCSGDGLENMTSAQCSKENSTSKKDKPSLEQ